MFRALSLDEKVPVFTFHRIVLFHLAQQASSLRILEVVVFLSGRIGPSIA
jgi:hypothetical protein